MKTEMIKDHKVLTAIFEWETCTSYNCKLNGFIGTVTFFDSKVLMSFSYKNRMYQGVTNVYAFASYNNAELFFISFAMSILNIKSKHAPMSKVFEKFDALGSKLVEFYSVDNLSKKNVREYVR